MIFSFCLFRVTAVDGHYQIGIYSVRKIQHGEEITFDYNSVTEVCPVDCQLAFSKEQCICFISLSNEYLLHLTTEQGGI